MSSHLPVGRYPPAATRVILATALFYLLIVTSAIGAPVPAKFLIVPGKSVGPLQTGMTRKQAERGMMSAFKARARRESVSEGLCWFSGNLCATFLAGKDSLVTVTVEKDRRFMTQEGVRVGSDANGAIALLGGRLGRPGVIRASDGAFVSWLGLQMTVGYASDGTLVVTSMMVSPKPK